MVTVISTRGIVFEAALSLSFNFKLETYADIKAWCLGKIGREVVGKSDIVAFIKSNPSVRASYQDTAIPAGLEWRIRATLTSAYTFHTPDMKAVRKEMLRLKGKREVAEAAPDPKTPKRTMKTRTDTV